MISGSDSEDDNEYEEKEEVTPVLTVLDLLVEEMETCNLPLMTFCKALDLVIGGGVHVNMLTELFGDKGIGKTTFCCQLCLNIQIPQIIGGHGAESLFIDTEGSFALWRVKVMARKFADHCRAVSAECRLTVKSLLNGIHYIGCGRESELRLVINGLHEYLTENTAIKLVVIDSLAYLYYVRAGNFEDRVKKMYSLSQELFDLMNKFSLVIVVSNNMTTRFREDGGEYFVPYLGESWVYLPHQRIQLTSDGTLRSAKVIKCPKGNSNSAYYRVNSAGIRD